MQKNTLNKLNRKVSLKNIKRLCLSIYAYLHNSYNTPARLYLEYKANILSQEGMTHGNNAPMAIYTIFTQPLIQALSTETANDDVKQVCFAEDSSAVDPLEGVKNDGTT